MLELLKENFKVIRQKRPSYGRFTFCVFFAFFVLKRFKFQKKYFLKVTLELGFVCP